jgi:hypothetical protein
MNGFSILRRNRVNAHSEARMKLVADANVWYHISTGRIDPLQFKGSGDRLYATPTSLLEIASGINERLLEERKGAALAVLKYADGVLEDSETHLAALWGVDANRDGVAWIDGFRAIASASSVEELEHGVFDHASQVIRRVGISTVHDWRVMHWRDFQEQIVIALDDWIPGYRDARAEGKFKRIPKQNKSAFQDATRSREVKVMLTLATYERVRLAGSDLPNPSNEQIAKAESLLAPYIDAYCEYIIRCATEYAPQENDFGDCENFIYLQDDAALVTSDDRWVKIAQTVCPTQIVVPEVRVAT